MTMKALDLLRNHHHPVPFFAITKYLVNF